MHLGIVLIFNIITSIGTIALFFAFWMFFKLFSKKIENILTRNFGDNLRNLYWSRKGKRYLMSLIKMTSIAFIFDLILYSVLFSLIQDFKEHNEYYYNKVSIISYFFIIFIVWIYIANWSVFSVFYLHYRKKKSNIKINIENLNNFEKIASYRLSNEKKFKLINRRIKFNLMLFEKTSKYKSFYLITKYTLVLIEMYALIMANEYIDKHTKDMNEYAVNCKNEKDYISKKDFKIEVNGFFSDLIEVELIS